MNPQLVKLIEDARKRWAAMTPAQQDAQLAEQRKSWVRGEMAFGTDKDEADYRAKLRANK